MMYGYGDDQNPYTESVDLLEDLVIEFITETTHRLEFHFKANATDILVHSLIRASEFNPFYKLLASNK